MPTVGVSSSGWFSTTFVVSCCVSAVAFAGGTNPSLLAKNQNDTERYAGKIARFSQNTKHETLQGQTHEKIVQLCCRDSGKNSRETLN